MRPFQTTWLFSSAALDVRSVGRIQPVFDRALARTIAVANQSPFKPAGVDFAPAQSVWDPEDNALAVTFTGHADEREVAALQRNLLLNLEGMGSVTAVRREEPMELVAAA